MFCINSVLFVCLSVTSIVMLIVYVRFVKVLDAPFASAGAENIWNLPLFCFREECVEDEDRLDSTVGVGRGWRKALDSAGQGVREL